HLAHHDPQPTTRQRVDPDPRLIEQQQPRPAEQRTREAELLLHAAGEAAGEPLGEWSEIGEAQELREAPLTRRLVESAEVRVETQVVEHREILVQPEALRHVAGLRLPRAALGDWSEIGVAQERRAAPLSRRLVESAEVRVETQVVEHREILVPPEALRHVAGLRLPRAALGARRAPEHLDGARRAPRAARG